MICDPLARRSCFALLILLLVTPACILGQVPPAHAGGGPENVLLVVNSNSWASMTVASHYIQWRRIPENNVLYLPWPTSGTAITVADFRQFLLGAVLNVTQVRGLGDQIDYVVYSSDFPTTIEITSMLQGEEPPEQFVPMASLTGMTYYWPMVQANNPTCLSLSGNRYMRHDQVTNPLVPPSRGFRSWYGWGEAGELREAGGDQYVLSAMLAVTTGRGNSVREALRYLYGAASADGDAPKGTVYYALTPDERTRRRDRDSSLQAAASQLEQLGVAAEVTADVLPRGKSDVVGLTVGTARFGWAESRSKIAPGAICDNFNFLGGALDADPEYNAESPLSVFLRYGAAGACGTVVQSYGFPQKFPTAQMHVHYARGCSLAEAVYQSVAGPYQLLLVGDPLCRPWAHFPRIETSGVEPGAAVQGVISLQPTASGGSAAVDRFQLFVDGVLQAEAVAGDPLQFDTTRLADGHHELRVVGVENSPIETQGRLEIPVVFNNHGHAMQFTVEPADKAEWGDEIKLRAEAAGAVMIGFYYGNLQPTNLLGQIRGESGEVVVQVDPIRFGYGPLKLLAVAYDSEDALQRRVVAAPVTLNIQPGPLMPGRSLRSGTALAAGLKLTNAQGQARIISSTRDPKWLVTAAVRGGEQFTLAGVFEVPASDVYQFQLLHAGSVRLDVDSRTIYEGEHDRPTPKYVPVVLGAGLHRIVVDGRAGSGPSLDLRFGSHRVQHVDGSVFQHAQ